ncbi:hypothetical protein K458DRAFT_303151, partial [Lentithecium fluviatile CBS 122367]
KKYTVIHFAKPRVLKKHGKKRPHIDGLRKDCVTSKLEILGVTLQSNLKWKTHVDNVRKKVCGITRAFRKVASSTHGVRQNFKQRLYLSTARTVLNYACAAWYCPRAPALPESYLDALKTQQNTFFRIILGGLLHNRRSVLRKESYIETLAVHLDQTSLLTRARLLATEVWDTIVNARNAIKAAYCRPEHQSKIPNQ